MISVTLWINIFQCLKLQSHAWVKGPLKVQDTPMFWKVTRYEQFLDIVSGSTLELNSKKLLVVEFDEMSRKSMHDYLKSLIKSPSIFKLHIHLRVNFLHRNYTSQQIECGSRYENHVFYWARHQRYLQKCKTMSLSFLNFLFGGYNRVIFIEMCHLCRLLLFLK